MTRDVFLSLYDYGGWATERLLGEAAKLPAAELTRRVSRGCDSVHETFVHLLSADRRWFARWRGAPLPEVLTATEVATLDAVRAAWAPLVAERRAYLAGLSEGDLAAVLAVTLATRTVSMVRWQALLQCANHGTQHRAEIAAMLSDAGHSPGDLDYSIFCCEPAR